MCSPAESPPRRGGVVRTDLPSHPLTSRKREARMLARPILQMRKARLSEIQGFLKTTQAWPGCHQPLAALGLGDGEIRQGVQQSPACPGGVSTAGPWGPTSTRTHPSPDAALASCRPDFPRPDGPFSTDPQQRRCGCEGTQHQQSSALLPTASCLPDPPSAIGPSSPAEQLPPSLSMAPGSNMLRPHGATGQG